MIRVGIALAAVGVLYLVVAMAVFVGLLSWEHMGRSGLRAMFRKKGSDWWFAVRVALGWLPMLAFVLIECRRAGADESGGV